MKFFKNGIFKMDAFQIEVVNSIKKGTFSKKKNKLKIHKCWLQV